MGLDCTAELSIGYPIDTDNLPAQFLKREVEQFVLEDRYDPRTGQKLPEPAKVITRPASTDYLLDGRQCEDVDDFLDALAVKVGGIHCSYGEFASDKVEHFIELPILPEQHADSVDFAWLVGQAPALADLGQKLNDLGLAVGKPTVTAQLSIG